VPGGSNFVFSRPALALPALCPARISVSSSLLAAAMNQKSSFPEVPQLVSQVLTANIAYPLTLVVPNRFFLLIHRGYDGTLIEKVFSHSQTKYRTLGPPG
jgi:hypothetical protein